MTEQKENCEGRLLVGSKRGCLEVIDYSGAYDKDESERRMEEKALHGILNGTYKPATEDEDELVLNIERLKKHVDTESLLCKCKCGKTHTVSVDYYLSKKRHRYCDDFHSSGHSWDWWKQERDKEILENGCGLRKIEREKHLEKNQRRDEHYGETLPFRYHDTLEIVGFGEEKKTICGYNRRNEYYRISKPYRCKCHLCGKEYEFSYEEFEIKNDYYGVNAEKGYYSRAFCSCHPISSFQWRTIKLFQENHIQYKAEVSFPDLMGIGQRNQLRYDFALFDDEELYALVECQGEQHYNVTLDFGISFSSQQENDNLKREYAAKRGIKLIEIPFTMNTYKKEEEFLRKMGLFKLDRTE